MAKDISQRMPFLEGGKTVWYNIPSIPPCKPKIGILDQIDAKMQEVFEVYKFPEYLVLNSMAFSNLVCALNKKRKILLGSDIVTEYKGMKVVVIPSLSGNYGSYKDPVVHIIPKPIANFLYKELNQEQF